MRSITSGLLMLVLVLVSGCSRIPGMTRPDLSLVHMRISDVQMFETSAEVVLRISNEEPEPLVVRGGVFKLDLQGVKVGRGLMSDGVEVPALGSVTVTVPVHISHLALATRLRSIMASKQVAYRLRGVLYRETAFGTLKLRSVGEGLVDFGPLAQPEAP